MHRILSGIPHKLYNSIEVNFKQWQLASKLNVGVSIFPMTEPQIEYFSHGLNGLWEFAWYLSVIVGVVLNL